MNTIAIGKLVEEYYQEARKHLPPGGKISNESKGFNVANTPK